MMPHAVLTADIVNSTKLKSAESKKLMRVLRQILSPHLHEFYRGDSFQVYITDPKEALKVLLRCRTAAISISESAFCDIRSSIGIGRIRMPVRKLATAKGEAFVLSGRAFDAIGKKIERLVIAVTENENHSINISMQLIAVFIDSIFRSMTIKQAQVVFELLNGKNQQDTADKLKKSKSTISQIVNSAKWSDIEIVMNTYETLINEIKL